MHFWMVSYGGSRCFRFRVVLIVIVHWLICAFICFCYFARFKLFWNIECIFGWFPVVVPGVSAPCCFDSRPTGALVVWALSFARIRPKLFWNNNVLLDDFLSWFTVFSAPFMHLCSVVSSLKCCCMWKSSNDKLSYQTSKCARRKKK